MKQRLELDAHAAGGVGMFRLVSAVVTGAGSAWLALVARGSVGIAIAVAGAVASVFWLVQFRNARLQQRNAADWYLELDDDGLTLAEGPQCTRLTWRELTAIEQDDEKLVVRLRREGAPDVLIEPRYRGHSLDTLVRTLADASASRRL